MANKNELKQSDSNDQPTQGPVHLPILDSLQAELASYGKEASSIEKCVEVLFSELPKDDAIQLLTNVLQKENQAEDFITRSNTSAPDLSTPELEKISTSRKPEQVSSERIAKNSRIANADDIAQIDSAHKPWSFITAPICRAIAVVVATVGFAAAGVTIWPQVTSFLIEYTSKPEIILVTASWHVDGNNELKRKSDNSHFVWNSFFDSTAATSDKDDPNEEELNNHALHKYDRNEFEKSRDYVYSVSDNLNLRVMKYDKSNLNWASIMARISRPKTECVILDSNSSVANDFIHEFDTKFEKSPHPPVMFPGQTAYALRNKFKKYAGIFLAPDDRKQSAQIEQLLKYLHPTPIDDLERKTLATEELDQYLEENRVAVIWDYSNPIYTKPLADKVEVIRSTGLKVTVFFGIGETQMENSSLMFGIESLPMLKELNISTVVFASSDPKTARRFLTYLDNAWPEKMSINVIFTEGIADGDDPKKLTMLNNFAGEKIKIYGIQKDGGDCQDAHGTQFEFPDDWNKLKTDAENYTEADNTLSDNARIVALWKDGFGDRSLDFSALRFENGDWRHKLDGGQWVEVSLRDKSQ